MVITGARAATKKYPGSAPRRHVTVPNRRWRGGKNASWTVTERKPYRDNMEPIAEVYQYTEKKLAGIDNRGNRYILTENPSPPFPSGV